MPRGPRETVLVRVVSAFLAVVLAPASASRARDPAGASRARDPADVVNCVCCVWSECCVWCALSAMGDQARRSKQLPTDETPTTERSAKKRTRAEARAEAPADVAVHLPDLSQKES